MSITSNESDIKIDVFMPFKTQDCRKNKRSEEPCHNPHQQTTTLDGLMLKPWVEMQPTVGIELRGHPHIQQKKNFDSVPDPYGAVLNDGRVSSMSHEYL
eukprot:8593428-Pyramimonas_sp.AAC.1